MTTTTPHPWIKPAQWTAVASVIALIALCTAWELRLAPVQPGGSWLVLKALPLLFIVRGLLHGRRYTFQYSSLLIQLYLLEGLTRATSDAGLSRWLALGELALALTFFAAVLIYARLTRPSVLAKREAEHSAG